MNDAHAFIDCRVLKLVEDYHQNLNVVAAARRSIPTIVIKQVAWSLPPQHWIKINTDGSCLDGSASAACGGIARNYDEQSLAAWSWHSHFVKALGCILGPVVGL